MWEILEERPQLACNCSHSEGWAQQGTALKGNDLLGPLFRVGTNQRWVHSPMAHLYRLRKQSEFRNRRTHGGLRNPQSHPRRRDTRASDQSAVADARGGPELLPLAVLPLIQSHGLDALAERQVLS